MSRLLLTPFILLALATTPMSVHAASKHNYTNRCLPHDVMPEIVELGLKDNGGLSWNGSSVDWPTFESYLSNKVVSAREYGSVYIRFGDEGRQRGQNVVAALRAHGFTLHAKCYAQPQPVIVIPN